MRTVENLTDSVAGILQGTNLDNVTDLFGAIERSARILALEADIPDSFGRENYMFYDGVFDYAAPSTIFGGAFADLRPQGVSRNAGEGVKKVPIELFDRTKVYYGGLGIDVTFEWDRGTPIMRVNSSRATQKLSIDTLSDATQWTPTTIPALFTDRATFYQEPSSIRFNLPTTGSLTRTLTNALDISSYTGVGSVFLAMRIESTDLTSVELRLGSDAANYYSVTVTEGFLGAWQTNNFYLTQFDLANAVTVGTPDDTNIDYIQLNFIATGAMTNVRVGGLFTAMPSAYELVFYSAAIFMHDNTPSNTITDINDFITLGDSPYTILQYITAETIALQMGAGLASQSTIDRINKRLRDPATGLLMSYRADNPSEELRQIGVYYEFES